MAVGPASIAPAPFQPDTSRLVMDRSLPVVFGGGVRPVSFTTVSLPNKELESVAGRPDPPGGTSATWSCQCFPVVVRWNCVCGTTK